MQYNYNEGGPCMNRAIRAALKTEPKYLGQGVMQWTTDFTPWPTRIHVRRPWATVPANVMVEVPGFGFLLVDQAEQLAAVLLDAARVAKNFQNEHDAVMAAAEAGARLRDKAGAMRDINEGRV